MITRRWWRFVAFKKTLPQGVFRGLLFNIGGGYFLSLEAQGDRQVAVRLTRRRRRDCAVVVGLPANWRPVWTRRDDGSLWIAWLLFAVSVGDAK